MIVLVIDTCLGACSAAVLDAVGGQVLSQELVLMDKGHAEAIAPMVDRCLAAAGISPQRIERIAVTCGPGTFTGIRIGLALAHGMAAALNCPVIGVDTLTATAAPLLADHPRIAVVHQAGATGRYYAGIVGDPVGPQMHFASAEDCLALAAGLPVIGTGADAIAQAKAHVVTRITGHDLPVAAAFARHASTMIVPGTLPMPIYLREPDAKPSAALAGPVLRQGGADDCAALARLHAICFDHGWDAASFASGLSLPGSGVLLAESDGGLRALLMFQIAADEAEITTLCTEPRWRGKGVARQLLGKLRTELAARSVRRLHLEVAADNSAALQLYSRAGFAVSGRRKAYYQRPAGVAVDAVLMSLTL